MSAAQEPQITKKPMGIKDCNMRKRQKASPRAVNDADKEVGNRIRARRLELHISQAELGAALGITFQQIQKYERGANRVATTRLVQVANFLKTTVSALAGADDMPRGGHQNSLVSEFIASKDGIDLIEAWSKVRDQKLRRGLIALARTLGEAYCT
jgi:transcriptional regulator with XRE-family HTH domain